MTAPSPGELKVDPSCATGLIGEFRGRHTFLSNYAPGPVTYEGMAYPTAEHAFAAAKTTDLAARRAVAAAATAGEAKRVGRQVPLRAHWDSRVRFEVMGALVASKFADPTLADQLDATGDALLVEGNTWHDQTWGSCSCPNHAAWPGRNELGRTLMRVRAARRGAPRDRWLRVACTGHRDHHLTDDQRQWMHGQLDRVAVKLIAEHGMRVAIHGGAIGADLSWARAATNADVDDLWAYLPFPDQTKGWTAAQTDAWAAYTTLRTPETRSGVQGPAIGRASLRWTLGAGYDVRLLHARNTAMIRDADAMVSVLDPTKTTGGTVSAMNKIGSTLNVIVLDIVNRTVRLRPAERHSEMAGCR